MDTKFTTLQNMQFSKLKTNNLLFAMFCLSWATVFPAIAQQSDSVNRCNINGQVVYQSIPCPSSVPKNSPATPKVATPSLSKPQDSNAMRAEIEALRVEKTKQKEEMRKAASELSASSSAANIPKTPSTAQTDNSTLSKSSAIDRMTTYTTVLGRGIGCGVSGTETASSRFGAWMDSQGLTKNYLLVAAAGIKMAAEQQRAGNSPDSCSTVRVQFASFPWP
jgi:hypothetical protein